MRREEKQARQVARLAAVLALYQMETGGTGAEAVIREFAEHRFDRDIDGVRLARADEAFFAELVRGVVDSQAQVDQAVQRHLASRWRLHRIDSTARAILRAGAFELMHWPEAPAEVVVDAYVGIARSFSEDPEPAFVNAALDAIARDERAG